MAAASQIHISLRKLRQARIQCNFIVYKIYLLYICKSNGIHHTIMWHNSLSSMPIWWLCENNWVNATKASSATLLTQPNKSRLEIYYRKIWTMKTHFFFVSEKLWNLITVQRILVQMLFNWNIEAVLYRTPYKLLKFNKKIYMKNRKYVFIVFSFSWAIFW